MATTVRPPHGNGMTFPHTIRTILCLLLIASIILDISSTAAESTVGRAARDEAAAASEGDDEESSWLWGWYEGATNRASAVWEAATGPVGVLPDGGGDLDDEQRSRSDDYDAAATAAKPDHHRRTLPPPSSSSRPSGKELGLRLLRNGDPSGAEVACSAATRRDTDDVDSWTCLGEARLALHEAAKRAGGGGAAATAVAVGKLAMAKESFEEAMSIDPTHPWARAGLGLSLLLMGTRSEGMELSQILSDASLTDMSDSLNNAMSASSTQLLLDSILHLQAAASLTAPNADEEGGGLQLHVAATHNAALAHLALGDASTAVPLLRRAADLVVRYHGGGGGVPAEAVNLSGALLQLGLAEDAVAIASAVTEGYCRDDDLEDGRDSGSEEKDPRRRRRRGALCSIAHNNLGVAQELMLSSTTVDARNDVRGDANDEAIVQDGAYESAVSHYNLSVRWDDSSGINLMNLAALSDAVTDAGEDLDEADGIHNAEQLKGENDRSPSEEDERREGKGPAISESGDGASTSFAEDAAQDTMTEKDGTNAVANVVSEEEDAPVHNDSERAEGGIPPALRAALEALEAAATKDPDKSRLWLSLSRARAHAGDKAGALEAAAKAVSVAVTKEDLDRATEAFEDTLDELTEKVDVGTHGGGELTLDDDKDSSTSVISTISAETTVGTSSDVNTLRLQQEILSLKLQLLQQKVMNGMAQMNEDYPWDVHRQRPPETLRKEPIVSMPHRANYDVASSEEKETAQTDFSAVPPEKANDGIGSSIEAEQSNLSVPPTEKARNDVGLNTDEENNQGTASVIVEAASQNAGVSDTDDGDVNPKEESSEIDEGHAESVDMGETKVVATEGVAESVNVGETEVVATAVDVESLGLGEDEVVVTEGDLLESTGAQLIAESDLETEETLEATEPQEQHDMALVDENQDLEMSTSGKDTDQSITQNQGGNDTDGVVEEESEQVQIVLPDLFDPPQEQPSELPAIASSYLKMADAYMQKSNYQLASKQFVKVLKKANDHIPAILGYATALERAGRPKQIGEVALAYGNATKAALVQGKQDLAEITLRRAVDLARTAQVGKVETLQRLSSLAFTPNLAADIYYYLGSEAMREESGKEDAMNAFAISNAFSCSGVQSGSSEATETNGCHGHGKSLLQLGKLALTFHEDAKEALRYFTLALESDDIGDDKVEALVYSGKVKKILGDVDSAILDYRLALDLPITEATPEGHHNLALALMDHGDDPKAVQNHFEQALNMGMELTVEAVNALGEHNVAVMRGANRQRWLEFENSDASAERGGIMSGSDSVVSSNSIFASQSEAVDATPDQSHLDMLEQGAAAYDGRVPLGGEGGDGTQSNIVTGQGTASSRARAA